MAETSKRLPTLYWRLKPGRKCRGYILHVVFVPRDRLFYAACTETGEREEVREVVRSHRHVARRLGRPQGATSFAEAVRNANAMAREHAMWRRGY